MTEASPPTKIARLRQSCGWNQQDLAARAGVSIRTIQRWEQRQHSTFGPDLGVVIRVADALGVPASEVAEPAWLEGTSWEQAESG